MIIEDEHFEYLVQQKGGLYEHRDDRKRWQREYQWLLVEDMRDLVPFMPVNSVLDIGSGLGGVNALINDVSGGDVDVCLLDGVADPPVMVRHRRTFNNMRVARDFLNKNGVRKLSFEPPDAPRPRPFDLVISFGSWCFHYEPEVYLEFVVQCMTETTPVVVDVRRDKPRWRATLAAALGEGEVVRSLRKADRTAYRRGR